MISDLIQKVNNTLGISTITLQSLIAVGFTFYASDNNTRMRNTLIVGGIGALFYINDQQGQERTNVTNYFLQ